MKHISIIVCLLFLFLLKAYSQLTYNELEVQYDSVWTYKNLKLIPVKFKSTGGTVIPNNGMISFSEAFQTGKITLHELSNPEGADINTLFIKNRSKKNIVISSGEMIEGGKQDRVSGITTIIPAEEDYYLPVFCIEKGRWNGKAKPFSYAGTVDAALKKQIDVTQKQNDIWKEIDKQYQDKNATADTWPYIKIYKDTSGADSSYMNYFMNRFKNSDSSFAGFVAITSNHIISFELFATPELCFLSYKGLINTYIHSVTDKEGTPSVEDEEVRDFLDGFMRSAKQQKRYLSTHGRIDTYDKKIIHLAAYPEE